MTFSTCGPQSTSADVAAGRTQRNVGIADLVVSADPAMVLATHALGSCLGITLWDRVAGVGGLLHAMLPTRELDEERARINPERFVDTGVPLLFHRCYALGARKERIEIRVAGGASMLMGGQSDRFQTGKRNILALRQLIWKNGVFLKNSDVGGHRSRSVFMHLSDGTVVVKSEGESYRL